MPDRFLIGCGCPRSGTRALARLLDAQKGVAVSHEDNPMLPWEADSGEMKRAHGWLERGGHFLGSMRRPVTGDVSFSWLPALTYCEEALGERLSVVVLRREAEEWLESVIENVGDPILHDDTPFAEQFPTFDAELEDAWMRYYDTYYANVEEDRIFDMMALGDKEGQDAILEACDIDVDTRIYTV